MIYDNVRYKVDSFPNRPFVVLGDLQSMISSIPAKSIVL